MIMGELSPKIKLIQNPSISTPFAHEFKKAKEENPKSSKKKKLTSIALQILIGEFTKQTTCDKDLLEDDTVGSSHSAHLFVHSAYWSSSSLQEWIVDLWSYLGT
jgi:hypothetical protein